VAKQTITFTKAAIDSLPLPAEGQRLEFYDTKSSHLLVRVSTTGRKTFQVYRWHQGKPSRVSLGVWPDLTIEQVRKAAEKINAQFALGDNPNVLRRAIREEMAFSELFTRWLEQFAKPHKRTWDEDFRRYQNYMEAPFGKKKLSWFDPGKVRHWHHGLTTQQKQKGAEGVTISGSTANRSLALLKTVFSQMAPEIPNPCLMVKAFREQSRERFLQPDELKRLLDALEDVETPPVFRDYILLSLMTGARRSNVLGMMWKDVDFNLNVWTIPGEVSKNGDIMRVPLVESAIEILKRRKAEALSVFVLPSDISKTGHYTTPTKAWCALLKRARLFDVRLHDLRRTTGSVMAGQGASLPIIGRVLGHKHQASTAVYARLSIDPLRDVMESATRAIMVSQDASDKVVPLRKMVNERKK